MRLDFEASDSTITFSSIVVRQAHFATLSANTISLSADSKGHIGYIDYPYNSKGLSFVIQQQNADGEEVFGEPLLFEGGLMLAADENLISDAVRGIDSPIQENDFTFIKPFEVQQSQDGSFEYGVGSFTDEGAINGSYNALVKLEMCEYSDSGHDQYIVLKYIVKNQGETTIEGMRLGLFLDFDLPVSNGLEDYGFYNSDDDILAMAVDGNEGNNRLMVGTTVLDGIYSPYLINNADAEMGTYDGFTDHEKWISLSRGKNGPTERGPGDISLVLSGQSFTFVPEEENEITIILAYGFGYNDLRTQVLNAKERAKNPTVLEMEEENVLAQIPLAIISIYPNPFNPLTTIKYSIQKPSPITLEVFDILGQKVTTLFEGYKEAGTYSINWDASRQANGIYIAVLKAGGITKTEKMMMVK